MVMLELIPELQPAAAREHNIFSGCRFNKKRIFFEQPQQDGTSCGVFVVHVATDIIDARFNQPSTSDLVLHGNALRGRIDPKRSRMAILRQLIYHRGEQRKTKRPLEHGEEESPVESTTRKWRHESPHRTYTTKASMSDTSHILDEKLDSEVEQLVSAAERKWKGKGKARSASKMISLPRSLITSLTRSLKM